MSSIEESILELLTMKAAVICRSQIAEHYTRGDISNAARLGRRLERRGSVRCFRAYARRSPSLDLLAQWDREMPLPDAGKVSWSSCKKWQSLQVRIVHVYAATGLACSRAGVPAARIKRHQVGHDLAVCDLALWFLRNRSEDAACWRGETMMAHTRRGYCEKLPDVFLVEADESVRAVLEICSGYRTARIREFMEDCRDRRLPFEIWG